MNPIEGLKGKFSTVRNRTSSMIGQYMVFVITKSIEGAKQLPDEKRRPRVETLKTCAELLTPHFTGVAYALHHGQSICHRLLGNPHEAFLHAGLAVDLHPRRDESSDFPKYVDDFMGATNLIEKFPEVLRRDSYQAAIDRLQGLIPQLPRVEYALQGFTGLCYDGLGERSKALDHHEKAVLLHPNNDQQPDFPVYYQNFLKDARFLTQEAIRQINSRQRDKYVTQLLQVLNSTGRLGIRYPNLESIYKEHQAAFSWFAKAVGPKGLRVAEVIRIHSN